MKHTVCITDEEKSAVLSQQYKSVFTVDNQILPQCEAYMPEDSILIQISERDIIQSIQNMNSDSSSGIDGIYPKVIKNVLPYLIKPMHACHF